MKIKKGISLIVLVITIIVIIILAGTVIVSLSKNNPIMSATEATFKASASEYNSELTLLISKKYDVSPTFDPSTLNAGVWDGSGSIVGTIKEQILGITIEDAKNYVISQGKLFYIGTDTNKKTWAKDTGITDGLILWLDGSSFTNSPQTASWLDKSEYKNNVVSSGFAYTTSSGSDGAGSVVFDGVNDNFTASNITMPANNFTISAWIYIKGHSTDANIGQIIAQQYSMYRGWIFSLNGTGSYLQLRNHNGTSINVSYNVYTSTGLSLNTWYYVVGSDDGTTVKLYVNGIKVASGASSYSVTHTTVPLNIGTFSTFNYFNGKMKRIQIYNRSLTDAEVLQNYNAGT